MVTVHERINAVMKSVGTIAKTRQNSAQNYAFRGIDDFYAALHPLFAEHGLYTLPEVIDTQLDERENRNGTQLRFVLLTVRYHIVGLDGDETVAVVVGEAMDSGDKAANKAMSAAQKYLFTQLFLPPTVAIEDADSESHEVAPRRVSQDELANMRPSVVAQLLRERGLPPGGAVDDMRERLRVALRAEASARVNAGAGAVPGEVAVSAPVADQPPLENDAPVKETLAL